MIQNSFGNKMKECIFPIHSENEIDMTDDERTELSQQAQQQLFDELQDYGVTWLNGYELEAHPEQHAIWLVYQTDTIDVAVQQLLNEHRGENPKNHLFHVSEELEPTLVDN